MSSAGLFFCGYLEQEELKNESINETVYVSDAMLRKYHSIIQPLPIICNCTVSSKTKFALTGRYLYYTNKNTLMRHDLKNSLKYLVKKCENYTDAVMLDTGENPIENLHAGNDFVTVIFKESDEHCVTLILSDDESSCTLDLGKELIARDFVYGKQFGIVCTSDKKLIRIQQQQRCKEKNICMEQLENPNDSIDSIEVSCGNEHAIILRSDGKILLLGGGSRGQIGNGATNCALQPQIVDMLEPLRFQSVSAGGWHCLVLSNDGDMYAWGWNESGQVGNVPCLPESAVESNTSATNKRNASMEAKEENISKLVFLPELVDTPLSECFISISTGSRHSAAVSERGVLYTWGWNGYGQLCHRDVTNRYTPTKVEFEEPNIIVNAVWCTDWGTLMHLNF